MLPRYEVLGLAQKPASYPAQFRPNASPIPVMCFQSLLDIGTQTLLRVLAENS